MGGVDQLTVELTPVADPPRATGERSRHDILGWTAVGVVGVGGAAYLCQRVLEIGPQRCAMRQVAGIPCPICGLSTVVSRGVRGDVLGALRLDTFGTVLLAVVAALAVLQIVRSLGLTAKRIPMAPAMIASVGLLLGHWVATLTGLVPLAPLT